MTIVPTPPREQEAATRREAESSRNPAPWSGTVPHWLTRPTSVLVPLDGSAQAIAALPIAGGLAKLLRATLHIIHVAELPLPTRDLLRLLGLTPEQRSSVVIDQTTGEPAARIVELARARRSALIVLCTHTHAAKPHDALGGVAEAVLRAAPCPVVLVRPARGLGPWELHRVLLPHDGTPTTAAAVEPAMDLVRESGAELHVLHVAAPGASHPPEPGTLTVPRYIDQPQHEWPLWAHEFLDRTRGFCHFPPSARVRLFLRSGTPGTVITRFASEHASDLIILAWHGSFNAARAFREVIRATTCPVMALRIETSPPQETASRASVRPQRGV